MRKYPVTLLFTLFAVVLCCLHYFGFDARNMLLFSFSVPLWFLPIFGDVRGLNVFAVYTLTIGSWAILGYIVDRIVNRNRARRRGY